MKNKANRAIEVLSSRRNLRKVDDCDLIRLINKIEIELEKREKKRKNMINSLEDMCDRMIQWDEEEYVFHYNPKNPEELMKADEDEITDSGFAYIRHQIGEREKKIFKWKERIFEVWAVIGDEDSWFYMEIKQAIEDL